MSVALEYARYTFREYDELCLIAGDDCSPKILLVPPFFDEMNRTRHMLCDVMRLLTEHGIGSLLPDLPGTNESPFPQSEASLTIWREAVVACLSQYDDCAHIAAFRGASLIAPVGPDLFHWQLSPAKGSSILTSMMRTRIISDKEAGKPTKMEDLQKAVETMPINLGGNIIGPAMATELGSAEALAPEQIRLARLENDSQPADIKLPGTPLWLRTEPDDDMILSAAIADDLASWVTS